MYTRGRSKIPFDADNLEHWAIGQHHKLKTPLLDWTASPYVAAYFAFKEIRHIDLPKNLRKKEDREKLLNECRRIVEDKYAIFMLNTNAVKTCLHEKMIEKARKAVPKEYKREPVSAEYDLNSILESVIDPSEYFQYVQKYFEEDEEGLAKYDNTAHSFDAAWDAFDEFPLQIFSPKNASDRLLSQRGIFVHWKISESMDKWFKRSLEFENILTKVTLPFEVAPKALDDLNSMNINQLSLFPDLDGAGGYCNDRVIRA
jgi:hypothetical protein